LRARRRQLERTWLGDPGEAVAGASLALIGRSGLTVVLAGGPPPRRVSVRLVARGSAGARARLAAAWVKLPQVEAPELALRLARAPVLAPALLAEAAAELAPLWPPAATRPVAPIAATLWA